MRRKQMHSDGEITATQIRMQSVTNIRYGHDSTDDMMTLAECARADLLAPKADVAEIASKFGCSPGLIRSRRGMGMNKIMRIVLAIDDDAKAVEKIGYLLELSDEEAKRLVEQARHEIIIDQKRTEMINNG